MGHSADRPSAPGSVTLLPVAVGDYFCSERDLYRVEQIGGDDALVEDCRSGNLIAVPLTELMALQRVAAE
jgi:hypothetical protein